MPKKRWVAPIKSPRDKAIDAIIKIAEAQSATNRTGAIVVPRSSLAVVPTSKSVAKARKQPPMPPTAMALALQQVGLAQTEPASAKQKPKVQEINDPQSRPRPKTLVSVPTAKPRPLKPKKKPKPQKQKPKEATKSTAARNKKASNKGSVKITKYSDPGGRAERMRERVKKAAEIISNIEIMPPIELQALWLEQIPRAGDNRNNFQQLARMYVHAIEEEWRRRTNLAILDPSHFPWPSTKANPGLGAYSAIEHTEGILGYLGYHVGKTGEASATRRQFLLDRIFEGPLPPINGPEYMNECGQAGTPRRLRKMAESIASAVKAAKRRSHADYSVAIKHWEQDLAYLYQTYYVDRFSFGWPHLGSVGNG